MAVVPLRPMSSGRAAALALSLGAVAASQASGQMGPTTVVSITGDRLSGIVLPIKPMPGELVMRGTEAWMWQVDDTRRVVLRGDVAIQVAGQDFRAAEAVVWFNRLPSEGGVINQIAIYFDAASDPTQRAGLGPSGSDLLVTASARGEIKLISPFVQTAPPELSIVARGERRLAEHLKGVLALPRPLPPTTPLLTLPQFDMPQPPPEQIPMPGASPKLQPDQLPQAIALPTQTSASLFTPRGVVAFSGGDVTIEESVDRIIIEKRVVVDYADEEAVGGPRRLTLTAERAVLFLVPGTLAGFRAGSMRLAADRIEGIYLEGDVAATDGLSMARGARIYYDVKGNRALIANAVLRTYAREGRVPIIARAEEMRQVSVDEYQARTATLSTSEFFVPHISLGASEVTVTRPPDPRSSKTWSGPGGPAGTLDAKRRAGFGGGLGAGAAAGAVSDDVIVDAQDVTLRAGRVPFFYWPRATARSGELPLRSLAAGYSENKGVEIETRWDLLSLLNVSDRARLDAELKLDGYTARGPGAGGVFKYDFFGTGKADLYGLYDTGTDLTSAGVEVKPSTEWRGLTDVEHRVQLDELWTLSFQQSWISDPTFVSTWRERDYAERREYETSMHLTRQEDNTAVTGMARYDLNSFISNEWLLGSRAYTIQRLPEGSYRRYADVLGDTDLVWSQEWRAARLRLLPTSGTPNSLGVPGAAFGLANNADIQQAFLERGYRSNAIGRFDTRQELMLPIDAGPVRVVPFGVVQGIGYMQSDFEPFSSDSEDLRGFAAGGVRASTQFQYVDNSVQSRMLGLHRMRHILEPGATAWYGWSNAESVDYPIYDQAIEGIDGTAAMDLHLRSTWQTQRGGPGRWRSVDWLMVELGGVINSSSAPQLSPTPQFFAWRPEYSRFGDHIYGRGQWQFSDALSFTGTGTYDTEDGDLAIGSVGMQVAHTPELKTTIEFRTIKAEESDLLDLGVDYRIGRKYHVYVYPQIDLKAGDFRAAYVALVREFPDFYVTLNFGWDEIQDEATLGLSLRPTGF
jgi:hypothetical protein